MIRLFLDFAKNRRGATAIEYGLICGLIALAIIGVMTTLFTKIGNTLYNHIISAVG